MENISRFISIFAVILLIGANSPASATTYIYDLNGSYADSLGHGPDLVAYGGTLTSTGYAFGQNLGLSLSNAINPSDVYSIEINFKFDSVNASQDGYQRIIDFKNRTSDSGFYSQSGAARFFVVGNGGTTSSRP
jgi:hypothetical protein